MAEVSIMWTTGSTGDGASAYTQAKVIDWLRRTLQNDAFASQGVLANFNNQLSCTPSTNQAQIGTGAASVYGFPYENDAAVNVNIPSAVGGGNTRIDRIVLRASWSAQTVRITRIAGVDAASPTPPALVQTPNTTYDLPLFQVRVNTSGTVTIELDERGYSHFATRVSTEMLDDLAVTSAKIADGATLAEILDDDGAGSLLDADKLDGVEGSGYATSAQGVTNGNSHDHVGGDGAAIPAGGLSDGAVNTTAKLANDIVDDTKAGNRVPQLRYRQGDGSAGWDLPGAPQTNTLVGACRMQVGTEIVQVVNQVSATKAVTFPEAFSANPIVIVVCNNAAFVTSPYPISTTGFTITIRNVDNQPFSLSNYCFWLAIGPE